MIWSVYSHSCLAQPGKPCHLVQDTWRGDVMWLPRCSYRDIGKEKTICIVCIKWYNLCKIENHLAFICKWTNLIAPPSSILITTCVVYVINVKIHHMLARCYRCIYWPHMVILLSTNCTVMTCSAIFNPNFCACTLNLYVQHMSLPHIFITANLCNKSVGTIFRYTAITINTNN